LGKVSGNNRESQVYEQGNVNEKGGSKTARVKAGRKRGEGRKKEGVRRERYRS